MTFVAAVTTPRRQAPHLTATDAGIPRVPASSAVGNPGSQNAGHRPVHWLVLTQLAASEMLLAPAGFRHCGIWAQAAHRRAI